MDQAPRDDYFSDWQTQASTWQKQYERMLRRTTNFVTLEFASPKDYRVLTSPDRDKLEQAERHMIGALVDTSRQYDALATPLTGKPSTRSLRAEKLLSQFEERVISLNPDLTELPAPESEVVKDEKPLIHRWRHGDIEHFRSARKQQGHAGVLALRLVERSALSQLDDAWTQLETTRKDLNYPEYRRPPQSPYPWAIRELDKLLLTEQTRELDELLSVEPNPFEFGDPQTPTEALDLAWKKARQDSQFGVVFRKYNARFNSTYRLINIHTVDQETRIHFRTNLPSRRKGKTGEFEDSGVPSIHATGPNGELYYLTPDLVAAEYYSSANAHAYNLNRRPFFFDYNRTQALGLSPEQQIDIWRAYCRAVCDVEATKHEMTSNQNWNYNLTEMVWGFQEPELDKYFGLEMSMQINVLRQRAQFDPRAQISLSIRSLRSLVPANEREVIHPATTEQLQQISSDYEDFWHDARKIKFGRFTDPNGPYVDFVIPSSNNDLGRGIEVRLFHDHRKKDARTIWLVEAPLPEEGLVITRYLAITENQSDSWSIERGTMDTATDGLLLQTDEKDNHLTRADADTIITAFNVLRTCTK